MSEIIIQQTPSPIVEIDSSGGPQGIPGPAGAGVASGGTDGQVLQKNSAAENDTSWTSDVVLDTLVMSTAVSQDYDVAVGGLIWDESSACIANRRTADVISHLGQDQHTVVKCVSSNGLIKGQVCMFAGVDQVSGKIEVTELVADGTYPGYVFFGVTAEDIPTGEFGLVCTYGYIQNIDTSFYPNDAILWACTINPGDMVLEQDLAPPPALKLPVAVVVNSDATEGKIFVRASEGAQLSLLHDVYIDNVQDGDVFVWNDNAQRYENKAPANASAPRSITIADPEAGDSFTIFKTSRQATITSVSGLVSGGSVTYELRYGTDRSGAGTLATVSETVTNATIGDDATIQNQPIPVNSWVWIEITGVSGIVDEFNVSIAF